MGGGEEEEGPGQERGGSSPRLGHPQEGPSGREDTGRPGPGPAPTPAPACVLLSCPGRISSVVQAEKISELPNLRAEKGEHPPLPGSTRAPSGRPCFLSPAPQPGTTHGEPAKTPHLGTHSPFRCLLSTCSTWGYRAEHDRCCPGAPCQGHSKADG